MPSHKVSKENEVIRNVVIQALKDRLLHSEEDSIATQEEINSAFFFDLDAYDANLNKLLEAFPEHFLHASAIKNNPLSWFIKNFASKGLGAECASMEEIAIARVGGVSPENIIYDSPLKTLNSLKECLRNGVHINIDNHQELERVAKLLREHTHNHSNRIGLRINPLLGDGAIKALSVSTLKSKFGLPLPSGPNLSRFDQEEREKLVEICRKHQFISCIHVHCGSGGMGVQKLCAGVKTAVDFALEVNAYRQKHNIPTLIDCIDIGGGLAANFDDEVKYGYVCKNSDAFAYYAAELRKAVPQLFDKSIFKKVITEFGAALNMNFATYISRVEYTKAYRGHNIICLHGGSDIFLRHAYSGANFAKNSVGVFDLNDKFIKARYNQPPTTNDWETYDFVGPLCFAGDIILKDVHLPKDTVHQNDYVAIYNCGGNSFSMKTMHCSKLMPPVYGYRVDKTSGINIQLIKKKQTLAHLTQFWD